MDFIRKNYEKRTAALSVIWLAVFTAFYFNYFNGGQFMEMTLVFIVGWFFSLVVLNKPKKAE